MTKVSRTTSRADLILSVDRRLSERHVQVSWLDALIGHVGRSVQPELTTTIAGTFGATRPCHHQSRVTSTQPSGC